jgi:hypothetical protein
MTIHPSRRMATAYFLGTLVMALVAAYVAFIAQSSFGLVGRIVGFIGLIYFGAVAGIFAAQLVWPNHFGLRLDSNGFTVTANLSSQRYTWNHVGRFFLVTTVSRDRVVAFTYSGKPEIRGLRLRRVSLRNFDGTLPPLLPLRGEPLLQLMEQWRARASAGGRFSPA